MIVPMKKDSLIIMGDKKKETLKKLRTLGLLHIEITEGAGEKLAALNDKMALLDKAAVILSERVVKGAEKLDAEPEKAYEIAADTLKLCDDIKAYKDELIAVCSELERIRAWGEVDPEELERLANKNVKLLLCESSKAEYEKLPDGIVTLPLSKTKDSVKFAVIGGTDEELSLVKHFEFKMPKVSSESLELSKAELEGKVTAAEEKLSEYSKYILGIKNATHLCEKEIEFEIYATGMNDEKMSNSDSDRFSVSHFKGYIEAEKVESITQMAKQNAWGILIEDPTEEDNVPTKLHNNKFVSLIYPLTDFLGTVPGYFEYDISGWFLAFILIFFGIIFYGGFYRGKTRDRFN